MRLILATCLLVGCEALPPSDGGPLAPLPAAEQPESTPAESAGGEEAVEVEGFDFDADARDPEEEEAAAEVDEPVTPEPTEEPEPVLEEPEVVEQIPLEPAPSAPIYAWDPESAPSSTWGIRLLSTVNSTLPPRAVIGLPDGSEKVVLPGTMLPEQRLIVMAVGREVIEVAHVVPNGVQARVETQVIGSLFPQTR